MAGKNASNLEAAIGAEEDKVADLSIEKGFTGRIIAGVDEAGRGPWAGPVVAAAVIINMDNIPEGINDSKKLSHKKRECLFDEIMATSIVGVGVIDEKIIDEINILQATFLAMNKALEELSEIPQTVLIDGNLTPKIAICNDVHAIIKGDTKSISIAAASIIAKVTRDRLMCEYGLEHPEYLWQNNAGYGTKSHQLALDKYGITKYHRKSFAPIKRILESQAV